MHSEAFVALGCAHCQVLKILEVLELGSGRSLQEVAVLVLGRVSTRGLGPDKCSADKNKRLLLGRVEGFVGRLTEQLDDEFGFFEVSSTEQVNYDDV